MGNKNSKRKRSKSKTQAKSVLSSNGSSYNQIPWPTRSVPDLLNEPDTAPVKSRLKNRNKISKSTDRGLDEIGQPAKPLKQPAPPVEVKKPINLYRALHDFEKLQNDDLPFKKGDIITVISKEKNSDWYLGQCRGKQGLVPGNFITKLDEHDAKSHISYHEIDRRDAERELVRPIHKAGTYVLRPCATNSKLSWALSVKFADGQNFDVKHYKIRFDQVYGKYYIHSKHKMPSISDLLDFYTNNRAGLVCFLSNPCSCDSKPPVNFRDLIIPHTRVTEIKKLGSGSFGEVWLGKLMDRVDVAIKKIKPGSLGSQAGLEEEAQTQHKLLHKNIVQLIGYCEHPVDKSFMLIMEFVEKGSLLNVIREAGDELTFELQIDYCCQTAAGMSYLETLDIIHRDLRAINVLLSESNIVKIADFGLSRVIEADDDDYRINFEGIYLGNEDCKFPIRWTSIEGLVKHEFSVKSDVWSFGVMMYEVLSKGLKPFHDMGTRQVVQYVKDGGRLDNPLQNSYQAGTEYYKWASYIYNEIMLCCWNVKKEERPTFKSIHDIFTDFSSAVERCYSDPNYSRNDSD